MDWDQDYHQRKVPKKLTARRTVATIIMARTDSFTQASSVWSKWPITSDAERERHNILQEFLVNATRDVRRDHNYTTHSKRTHSFRTTSRTRNETDSGSALLTSGARYVRIYERMYVLHIYCVYIVLLKKRTTNSPFHLFNKPFQSRLMLITFDKITFEFRLHKIGSVC